MKLCIVVDDYLPHSRKIGAIMMHDMAVELVSRGHQVFVLTPSNEACDEYIKRTIDGVQVLYFKSPKIKGVNKYSRLIGESLFSFNAWRALKVELEKYKCDLIVYYSPSIFWGGLVLRLKKRWKAKTLLILRDIFPQWAIDSKLITKGSMVSKYLEYYERKTYLAADLICVQSEGNLDFVQARTKRDVDVQVLYNWARLGVESKSASFRADYQLEGKVIFFYGGNTGHAQDMNNLVELANSLRDNDFAHFLIVGDGDEFELVEESIVRLKLTNLTLLRSVPNDEYMKLLLASDVGLLSLHRDHTTHNVPGKMLGYMINSKPILASVNSGNDLFYLIRDASAGLVSINGEHSEFVRHALQLIDDRSLLLQMSQNSRKLAEEKFAVEGAVDKIEKFMFKHC